MSAADKLTLIRIVAVVRVFNAYLYGASGCLNSQKIELEKTESKTAPLQSPLSLCIRPNGSCVSQANSSMHFESEKVTNVMIKHDSLRSLDADILKNLAFGTFKSKGKVK